MKNRQPGCICELKEDGEPVTKNYGECPVHSISPQEKAQEILNKYFDNLPEGHKGSVSLAKQYSLIAVDEIILSINPENFTFLGYKELFWKQVKEQISLM